MFGVEVFYPIFSRRSCRQNLWMAEQQVWKCFKDDGEEDEEDEKKEEEEQKHTPWKINMEHNHGGLEDHFPFKTGGLYVPC